MYYLNRRNPLYLRILIVPECSYNCKAYLSLQLTLDKQVCNTTCLLSYFSPRLTISYYFQVKKNKPNVFFLNTLYAFNIQRLVNVLKALSIFSGKILNVTLFDSILPPFKGENWSAYSSRSRRAVSLHGELVALACRLRVLAGLAVQYSS